MSYGLRIKIKFLAPSFFTSGWFQDHANHGQRKYSSGNKKDEQVFSQAGFVHVGAYVIILPLILDTECNFFIMSHIDVEKPVKRISSSDAGFFQIITNLLHFIFKEVNYENDSLSLSEADIFNRRSLLCSNVLYNRLLFGHS